MKPTIGAVRPSKTKLAVERLCTCECLLPLLDRHLAVFGMHLPSPSVTELPRRRHSRITHPLRTQIVALSFREAGPDRLGEALHQLPKSSLAVGQRGLDTIALSQLLCQSSVGLLKCGGTLFDEHFERLMTLTQGDIGLSAFRDIDEGGAAGDEPTVGFLNGRGAQQNRQQGAVFAPNLELQIPHDSSLDETWKLLVKQFGRLGGEKVQETDFSDDLVFTIAQPVEFGLVDADEHALRVQ